jgi:hypothetical protein
VELGLGAGGEVNHADDATVGVVEGWLVKGVRGRRKGIKQRRVEDKHSS